MNMVYSLCSTTKLSGFKNQIVDLQDGAKIDGVIEAAMQTNGKEPVN